MSLTSYRAAPPRVGILYLGPRLRGGVTAAWSRWRSPGLRNSYEPDELPGCSTPRMWLCARRLAFRPDAGSCVPGLLDIVKRVLGEEVSSGIESLATTYSPTP